MIEPLSFAFNGNTQTSADSMRKRQAVAQAMMGSQSMPQDIGQGLQALGNALYQRKQQMGPFPGAPAGSASPNFGTTLSNFFGLNRGGLY